MILILLTSVAGAIITYYLHNSGKLDVVDASALPSLVFAILCKLLINTSIENDFILVLPIVFFGATFIGMSKKTRLLNYLLVALSGLVFGIIYVYFSNTFKGFGGGLGTTAAISVLFAIGISEIYRIIGKVTFKLKEKI